LNYHILKRETIINESIDAVFDFFSKAENLNHITPPELGFKIITQLPIDMKKGTIIDYKIKLNGFPFKWKTEITNWDPPFYFEDTQIRGPYKMWCTNIYFRIQVEKQLWGIKSNIFLLVVYWSLYHII
jgi:ligand-binding SRPBCC domain-containing protein